MSKAVPKLRFKEFNDKWQRKKLGDFTKINQGLQIPISERLTEKIDDSYFYITNEFLKRDSKKAYYIKNPPASVLCDETDLLMTRTGNTGQVVTGVTGAFHNNFFKIKLNADHERWFLYYFLTSHKTQHTILKLAGTSTIPDLNHGDFYKIKINTPLYPEQQKIASFLSAVDEKIQQLTRKKELLEQYKKGVMQQLFCLHYDSSDSGDGHDGLSNHGNQKNHSKSQFRQLRFKDESGKAYPKWEEKRLGEIGDIISGLTYSPEDIHEDGVLVLRSSNVQNRKLTFDDNVYVKVEKEDFNPVKENDILICVRNGSKDLIGKNAIIDKNNIGVAFGAFMTVYRSKYNKFLFHFFDTDIYNKEVHKNLGATINSINGSDLKKFKFPFPSEPEQQKIANFLSAIDTKIESVATQIEKTQTFKKGLLQQMFV